MVKNGLVEACQFSCAKGGGGGKCDNKASQVEFKLGLGVARLNIYNADTHSFILSTKTFLRTVCSQRYYVKKLTFLITLFF